MTGRGAYDGLVLQGADWRGRSYQGQRVAVIAPGREAAAIVAEVAGTASSVKVFQTEPDWLVPRALPLPGVLLRGVARLHLRLGVRDPWTRRQLTPDGRFNTRRPRVDRGYYAALQRPGCTLHSWPVYALVPQGLRSAEGIEHHVDCIILGSTSPVSHPDLTSDHQESCA